MFLGQSTESGWVPTGGWNEVETGQSADLSRVSTDNRTETGQSADLSRVSTDNRTETGQSGDLSRVSTD